MACFDPIDIVCTKNAKSLLGNRTIRKKHITSYSFILAPADCMNCSTSRTLLTKRFKYMGFKTCLTVQNGFKALPCFGGKMLCFIAVAISCVCSVACVT